MPRLFIAVDMPEEFKAELARIRRDIPKLRWTPPEQAHLTLTFLGDVADDLFIKLKKDLVGVGWSAFELTVEGAGFFPSRRRPQVFWLGFADRAALTDLKSGIDRVVEALGFSVEKRKFKPHLTLARMRRGFSNRFADELLELGGTLTPRIFPVSEFHLYSSELNSEGAVHRIEGAYSAGEMGSGQAVGSD